MRTSIRFAAAVLVAAAVVCATPPALAARRPAAPDDTTIVIEIRMTRAAVLNDSRGTLRVLDQEATVEYRAGGRGPGLDAGQVTLDGHPLRAEVQKKGRVIYHAGRGTSPEETGSGPWMTLANSGGAGVGADSVRVKVAPFPAVTRPIPGETMPRDQDLPLVMLPPVADIWFRVSLVGTGDPVLALDMGEGRWVFPHASLEPLDRGPARIKIEVETSCSQCPTGGRLRATWTTRSELEVPVSLL